MVERAGDPPVFNLSGALMLGLLPAPSGGPVAALPAEAELDLSEASAPSQRGHDATGKNR